MFLLLDFCEELYLTLLLPIFLLHDLVQSHQVMKFLLQFHYSVVEVEGRGLCAQILWCKYLLYNELKASPVIGQIKVI